MDAERIIRWHHAFAQPVTYLGVITIIVILSGAFFLEKQEYDRGQQEGIQRGININHILEEGVLNIFRSTDRELLILGQAYQRKRDDFDLIHWLNKARLSSGLGIQFAIVGRDGFEITDSSPPHLSKRSVGDRGYFLAQTKAGSDRLFVSAPTDGRSPQEKTLQLSRRLSAADGSFDGIILASIDVFELQRALSQIDVGQYGLISLLGFDGAIRACVTRSTLVGSNVNANCSDSRSKLLKLYPETPRGHFWSEEATAGNPPGGGRRLVSYRTIEDLQLVAVVELAEPEILKHARSNARIAWSKALFFAGAILVAISIAATRERKLIAATLELSYRARHDLLTGLANRQAFAEECERALSQAAVNGEKFNVFMLDLDRFKEVNDLLGHPAGDALLKETAYRLKSLLSTDDFVARLGGDEFAIIQRCKTKGRIKDVSEREQREVAVSLAQKIITCLERSFEIDGNSLNVGTSIGIALTQQNQAIGSDLVKRADLALYAAKAQGRSSYAFFDPRMMTEIETRHRTECELRKAISNNELELHYQHIVDAATGRTYGIEAFVRWRHPIWGLICPQQFIPVAEASDLIVPLGKWVLQRACTDGAEWPAGIKIVVNLSTAQFKKSNLVADIVCALRDSRVPATRLEVDVNESALFDNNGKNLETLYQLKRLGITIALDDFGTGTSSLNSLTIFPFDKIKIDRSFILNMTKNPACAAVIATVITLGRCLDILTTAEGVESRQEFESLRVSGINLVQGYFFGRPCPLKELSFDEPCNDETINGDGHSVAAS